MNNVPVGSNIVLFILTVWSLIWKGIALWRAAKHDQRNWYIAMLILNTVGILEIVYLFRYSKKKMTIDEVKHWFKKTFTQRAQSKS